MHERTDFLTIHDLFKVAFLVHIEDIDRQMVVLAHTDSSEIHDTQAAVEHLLVADVLELLGR